MLVVNLISLVWFVLVQYFNVFNFVAIPNRIETNRDYPSLMWSIKKSLPNNRHPNVFVIDFAFRISSQFDCNLCDKTIWWIWWYHNNNLYYSPFSKYLSASIFVCECVACITVLWCLITPTMRKKKTSKINGDVTNTKMNKLKCNCSWLF